MCLKKHDCYESIFMATGNDFYTVITVCPAVLISDGFHEKHNFLASSLIEEILQMSVIFIHCGYC